MNMMLDIKKTVLLFPEPEATGGQQFDMSEAVMAEYDRKPWEEQENAAASAAAADAAAEDPLADLTGGGDEQQAEEKAVATDESDPFDFTKEVEEKAEENTEEAGEYVLELGDSFGGSDEVRSMLTGHARELGLPADKAGKFVAAVCESLKAGMQEQRNAGYSELKKEWGRDAGANFDGTKRVLNDMLKAGVIKAEQVEEFKSPAVFRAINYLRSRMGEQGTKGLGQTATASKAGELKDILENPDNSMFQILMNPMHPKYAETAKYVNGLAGMQLY